MKVERQILKLLFEDEATAQCNEGSEEYQAGYIAGWNKCIDYYDEIFKTLSRNNNVPKD